MIVLVVIVLEVNIEVTVVVIAKTSVPVTIHANSDPGGDNGCSGVGNSGIGGDGDVSLQSQKTFTSPASGNHPYSDLLGFLPSLFLPLSPLHSLTLPPSHHPSLVLSTAVPPLCRRRSFSLHTSLIPAVHTNASLTHHSR